MNNAVFGSVEHNNLLSSRLKELNKLKSEMSAQKNEIGLLEEKTIIGAELFKRFKDLISEDIIGVQHQNNDLISTLSLIHEQEKSARKERMEMLNDPLLPDELKEILLKSPMNEEEGGKWFRDILPLIAGMTDSKLTIILQIHSECQDFFFNDVLKPNHESFKLENIQSRLLSLIGVFAPFYSNIKDFQEFVDTFNSTNLLLEKARGADQVLNYLKDYDKAISIWIMCISKINSLWKHMLDELKRIDS